jgi:hypothetical protein
VKRFRDGLFVLYVVVVAAVVPLLMRLPLDWLHRLLEPRRPGAPASHFRQVEVLEVVNKVLERGRPVLRTSCLTRGITRYYFLRRTGLNVALAFGVGAPTRTDTTGHCWLVKDDAPFLETRDPRPIFTEVFRLQPA